MASEEDKAYLREQLAEARRILREDRILARLSRLSPDEPVDPDSAGNADGKPPAPKKKDQPDEPPKKRRIWWGDALDE
jgi:hypothetical protein